MKLRSSRLERHLADIQCTRTVLYKYIGNA